jgi:hypothetical protein
MTRPQRLRMSACLLLAACALMTHAQTATPPAGSQRRSMPPPTNLKVLPRDTSSEKVHEIMHAWTGDLGVECSYCHAKDPATGRNNFASDDNPMKDRARLMMKMTSSINKDFLAQLTDPKPTNGVGCGTCHRGMAKPSVFVPPPPAPRSTTPPPPPPSL